MSINVINGIRIYSESHGEGPPVVLVHGSWGDHHNWDLVVAGLARTFRTLTYDRRGHSQSERLASQGSIEEDVADLALLMTSHDVAPAHIVGNSFGGSIVSEAGGSAAGTVRKPDGSRTTSLWAPRNRPSAACGSTTDRRPSSPRCNRAGRRWARSSSSRPLHWDRACGKNYRPSCNRRSCSMHRRFWTRLTIRVHSSWTSDVSQRSTARRSSRAATRARRSSGRFSTRLRRASPMRGDTPSVAPGMCRS